MESPPNSSITTVLALTRPITSKARGVCKYYTDPRGCYAKDKCKFLHSETPKEGEAPILTPYDSSKICKFYVQGYCRRGDQCWFLHTGRGSLEEEDDLCSICFEKPTTYALLAGCSHIFCTSCIKQWRDPERTLSVVDSGNTKRCPMCRTPSRFITPSSKFWPEGSAEKQKTIEAYRKSMSRVQCRYFEKSIGKDNLICPFGNECFYQHKKPDGTLHHFKDGIEVSMRRYRLRNRNHRYFGEIPAIDFANLTFAAALDLNPQWFEVGAEAASPPSGEAMAVAFEMLRNHIRETNGETGPAQPGQDDSETQNGEASMMMRFLDVVRDQLIPSSRPASASANRPLTNSTRNGTASVADTVDEAPPPLEDVPRRSGYDSDDSIPGLQSVSASSESGDDEHDGLLRADGDFDGDAVYIEAVEENRMAGSRPASSARFSTVVDRSSTNTPSNNTPTGPQAGAPITLQWAEALHRMDNSNDSDDEGEDLPALEQIPNPRNTPSGSAPAQPQPISSAISDVTPPEGPSVRLPPSSTTSSRPAGWEATCNTGESNAPPTLRKRSVEQDFTTDGRGRVISIGGAEPSVEVHAPVLSQPEPRAYAARGAETLSEAKESIQTVNPPPILRQASEFTTDGRGRVISIGEPTNAGSLTTVEGGSGGGISVVPSTSEAESEDQREVDGGIGGLFSWFNTFF